MSLTANLPLVTKVYFPRTLLPLAAVLVPLVDFVVGLPGAPRRDVVLRHAGRAGLEVMLAPAVHRHSQSSTALGTGFFLSAMNVRYRDVRYMIPVFLQVLPLLSGVMYAVDEIPRSGSGSCRSTR